MTGGLLTARRKAGARGAQSDQTGSMPALVSYKPNTATARIGDAVPSRIFIGNPMNVNCP